MEILNDINHDLDEFLRYFRYELVSRDEFERLKNEPPENLTDIQRAARFYYLLKLSYAARLHNPSFSISTTRGPRLNLLRVEEELSETHLRLSRVYIESQPYLDMLSRYDKPDTFFYLDPPYYGHENDYGRGIFDRGDFAVLKNALREMKGRFLLSLNDTAETRELFSEFRIETVPTTYAAAGANKRKRVEELFIMNYESRLNSR